jgi:hypothetical protein
MASVLKLQTLAAAETPSLATCYSHITSYAGGC